MAHVIRTALRFRVFLRSASSFYAVFLKCWGVGGFLEQGGGPRTNRGGTTPTQ